MRCFTIAAAAVVVLALAPRPAQAQGFFVPFFGYDVGGNAGYCPSILSDCSVKRTAWGFDAGRLSRGVFGFEEDVSYAPDFFGSSPTYGANSVLTLMSNLVVNVPAGPVRPYLSGGFGLMRTKVEPNLASLLSTDNMSFGFDIGGGVMIFLPSHMGVRVDYRNIRSASEMTIAGFTVPGQKLSFSRLAFGLVLH